MRGTNVLVAHIVRYTISNVICKLYCPLHFPITPFYHSSFTPLYFPIDNHLVTELIDAPVAQLAPLRVREAATYLDDSLAVSLDPLSTSQCTIEAPGERHCEADFV